MAMAQFMQKKSVEILEAAGAEKVWTTPIIPQNIGAHLLGTCRMGTDSDESVINPWHQTHEVPNLYLCDGSSLGNLRSRSTHYDYSGIGFSCGRSFN